eukprot:comp22057_c1_seq1/m.32085 comp22057_c1_seq1/g.32085  ORF comp22057_c1_seq1/g.32085 comp22057_c1_seq1/m.32085 type:complete len:221 (-) comp22057_c1_seq1:686-1348(-)
MILCAVGGLHRRAITPTKVTRRVCRDRIPHLTITTTRCLLVVGAVMLMVRRATVVSCPGTRIKQWTLGPARPFCGLPKKRERSGSCVEYIHMTVRADLIRGPFYARYQTYAVSVMAQHPLFGEQSFTVRRRFCEFYALHQQLVTVYLSSARRRQEARSDRGLFRELLRWKPKKVFWGGLIPSVVEQRRTGFEHLLKVASSDSDLVKCLVEFLCGYSSSDI